MKFDIHSIGMALVMSGAAFTASAAVFDVTTTLDRQDANLADGLCDIGDGKCSLRAAVQEANAQGGSHTINLSSAHYELALAGRDEDQAAMGDLDTSASEITINGVSAFDTVINGLGADRVFDVIGGKLVLNDLTVANGNPYNAVTGEGSGGGINNKGTLVLRRVDLRDNEASTGGGIHNNGFGRTVSIIDSVIRDNNGKGSGGAIRSLLGRVNIQTSSIRDNFAFVGGGIWNSTGYVTVNRSEFSQNSTNTEGGAIYMDGGPRGAFSSAVTMLTVKNSSISENSAAQNGAGIYLTAGSGDNFLAKLSHTTIVNNTSAGSPDTAYDAATGGSGIYAGVGYDVELINSVVADNPSSQARHQQCRSVDRSGTVYSDKSIISNGSNFISDGSCSLVAADDVGVGAAISDGGPTHVIPLLSGSVAINASTEFCESEDQRGYIRTDDTDTQCDAGAYEFNGTTPSSVDPDALLSPLVVNNAALEHAGGQLPVVESSEVALLLSPGETTVMGITLSAPRSGASFLMESEPAQGTVELQVSQSNLLTLTFIADANAVGSDSLSFRVCDSLICSERVEVVVHYSDLDSIDSGTYTPPTTSNANLNDYGWVNDSSFDDAYPDDGFTHLGGVFFYRLSNVSGVGATLTIDVPEGVELPAGAVVRAPGKNGEWVTVGSATIDSTGRTITLSVFDNVDFDYDARAGEVSGQVALAIVGGSPDDDSSNDNASGDTSGSGSTNNNNGGDSSSNVGGGGSASDSVPLEDGSGTTAPVASGGGGGGGAVGYLALMMLSSVFIRRFLKRN